MDSNSDNDNSIDAHTMDKTSCTIGRYSNFDDLVGTNNKNGNSSDSSTSDDFSSDDEKSNEPDAHDVSTHLKGSLAFGLPANSPAPSRQILKSFANSSPMSYKGLPVPDTLNRGSPTKRHHIQQELEELEKIEDFSEELKQGFTVLSELMSDTLSTYNYPFLDKIDHTAPDNQEYLEVNPKPLWFRKIRDNFFAGDYNTITSLIKDIRILFENTYKYFGPTNAFSKRALHLEYFLEQKLAKLPQYIQDQCTLDKTHTFEPEEKEITRSKAGRIIIRGREFFSKIMFNARGCRLAREKLVKLRKSEAIKQAKLNKEMEIVNWEVDLLSGSKKIQMEHMWELVQVGQFIGLALPALNIPEVSQYELERCLLVPESSIALRIIFTTLVSSPMHRTKILEKPYMPYSVWAKKLANKTFQWYKVYQKEQKNADKTFEHLGIEQKFWLVCGSSNPFQSMLFHEMTYYQRVWLLKSLCDYVAHNHKSVQEVLAEQPEEIMRESSLGQDDDDDEYLYFPQFANYDIRIYKRAPLVFGDLDGHMSCDDDKSSKLFTKEQIRHYKSIVKKSKTGQTKRKAEDDEWFNSQTAKKKAKRRRTVPVTPSPQIIESRTRPTNLRQRPKMRFTEDAESSDEEYVRPPRKSGTRASVALRQSSSSDEESEEKDDASDIEPVNLSRVKNTRARGRAKKKCACEICGKMFQNAGSLKGHMSVHSKSKSQPASRESTPVPQDVENAVKTEDLLEAIKEEPTDHDIKSPDSVKSEPSHELDAPKLEIKSEPDADPEDNSVENEGFQLVVTNLEEFRVLIQKFGPLPRKTKKDKCEEEASKEGSSDETKEKVEPNETKEEDTEQIELDKIEDEKYTRKLNATEQNLYKNLCELFVELLPFEARLRTIQKSCRRKMYNEHTEWKKRSPTYVDPAEEAWLSESEILEPSTVLETPKPSSSSAPSEDEFYDDGLRKRKLRKRKAKRNTMSSYMTSAEPTPVPSPLYEDELETRSVSSRGRIRTLRKMVDYDQLDFDKLADEATQTLKEKKRGRLPVNDEPEADQTLLQEATKNLNLPTTGVRRYVMGSSGNVTGYIDTGGQVHHNSRTNKEDGVVKTSAVRPISAVSQSNASETPVFMMSAVTSLRSRVCLKVFGSHALNLGRTIKNTPPNSEMKINHANQLFLINSSDSFLTKNIPGFPQCDLVNGAETLARLDDARQAQKAPQVSQQPTTPTTQPKPVATSSKTLLQPTNGKPDQVKSLADKNARMYAVSNEKGGYSLSSAPINSVAGNSIVQQFKPVISPARPVLARQIMQPQALSVVRSAQTVQTQQYIQVQQQPSPHKVVQIVQNPNRVVHVAQTSMANAQPIGRQIYVTSNTPNVSMASTSQPVLLQAEQPTPQYARQVFFQQPQVIVQPAQPTPYLQPAITPKPVVQNKLMLLQTNAGQKVCYQNPQGTLVVLTDEQLTPLLKNGTIKLTNS